MRGKHSPSRSIRNQRFISADGRSPADIRGAYHALTTAALESAKVRAKEAKAASLPPAKKRKTSASSSRTKRKAAPARDTEKLDAYHYIGYVPARGRVWELDGLRAAGPLDVGEIHSDGAASESRAGWMDVVRPVLQRRMQRVLEGGGEGHIQYNLLAIVDDLYLGASDELELLKRERAAVERRLGGCFPDGWADKVRAPPFITPLSRSAFVLREVIKLEQRGDAD